MQSAVYLLDKIISKGIDPALVIEVFAWQLGWIVVLAVPMGLLLATLWTFGRMSGDNEITSIKASGQNVATLMIPVLAAASVLTVLLFFFNDLILPDANHKTANLLSDISRKRPAALIEPKILIRDFAGYAIYTEEVNPRTGLLTNIRIFSDAPNQDPSITIADSGSIRMTADQQYLEVTLYYGETHTISREKPDEYFVGKFEKQIICIKNVDSQFQRTQSSYRSDREKSSSVMLNDVAELEKSNDQILLEYNVLLDTLVKQIKQLDSLSKSSNDTVQNSDSLTFASWAAAVSVNRTFSVAKMQNHENILDRLLRRINSNKTMISSYMVEVHKKFAIPAACIIFVIIGAPLGIMAKRGGLTMGASYSLFFFIVNWAFLIVGESLADKMKISPAVAMWSGNVLVFICGLVLIVLMLRETTIRFDWLSNLFKKFSGKEKSFMNKVSNNFIFKIPRILFWTPRWICRKFIGILPTYLLGSFVNIAIGLTLALAAIFVFMDYVSNLRKFEFLSAQNIIIYYWNYLAWIVQIIIPIVLLLSSMFSIGKMAKTSELTAMKSAGINIWQLTSPLLFLGLVLSVLTFYGGEKLLPRANIVRRDILENKKVRPESHAQNTEVKEFRRDFYYFGDPQTIYMFREFSTIPQTARTVSRDQLRGNRVIKRIQAEKMVYDSTGWTFINGKIRDFSDSIQTVKNFDTLKDTILTSSPVQMVARIKSIDEMSYWELKAFMEASKKRGENVQKYNGDLEFKIALPLMNFIVILLGISITARAGRKGGAMLFGIGLAMCLSYWIISRFAIAFAQNGHYPTIVGAWFGNILFLLIGLILYRKAAQ
jgi:lipopolysaccharide export system permease protein